jgi:hypothetical protein
LDVGNLFLARGFALELFDDMLEVDEGVYKGTGIVDRCTLGVVSPLEDDGGGYCVLARCLAVLGSGLGACP